MPRGLRYQQEQSLAGAPQLMQQSVVVLTSIEQDY